MIKLFTQNLPAKILSIIFATILWIYVVGVSDKVGDFPVKIPVVAKNISSDLALATELPEITLKLRAPYVSWQRLVVEDFSAYVDLGGYGSGDYEVNIQVSCKDPEVFFLEEIPSKVRIKIDPLTSKKVPVEAKFEGQAGEGYLISESVLNPKEVEIKGAESIISNIFTVYGIVYLNEDVEKIERKVDIVAYDTQGNKINNITISPGVTDALISIQKLSNIKRVGVKVNTEGSPNDNYWISKIIADPSTLTITGKENILKDINYIETEKINIANITKNSSYKIKIKIPEGVNVSGDVKEITVKVFLTAQESSRNIPATIKYKNGTGTTGEAVNVVISGPIFLVSSIQSINVVVTIDLAGKAPGNYTFDISKSMISVPSGIIISSYSPDKVTIKIK